MAPALRSRSDNVKVIMPVKAKVAKRIVKKVKQTFVAKDDDVDRESFFFLSAQQYTLNSHGYFSSVVKEFPLTAEERAKYINLKTNRMITPFQFKVYDLCAQVLKVGF